jgi:hypothetical protein
MRRSTVIAAGAIAATGVIAMAGMLSRVGAGQVAGAVARTDHAFEFTVQMPKKDAFPLFGAWGERAWGGESWNPRFLYPTPPRDEAGEVFTVSHGHGHHDSVWVNTAFDQEAGRIQYVYVVPGFQLVLIDLALEEDAGRTRVRVRYRRTALEPEKNEEVEALGRRDASSGDEWAVAVNDALRPRVSPR